MTINDKRSPVSGLKEDPTKSEIVRRDPMSETSQFIDRATVERMIGIGKRDEEVVEVQGFEVESRFQNSPVNQSSNVLTSSGVNGLVIPIAAESRPETSVDLSFGCKYSRSLVAACIDAEKETLVGL